jgi:hypothetical protein
VTGVPDPAADAPLAPQARERAIEELSARFATDELTLDELERRLERVYKARTAGEMDMLLADLRASAPVSRGAAPAAAGGSMVAAPGATYPAGRAPAGAQSRSNALRVKPERVVSIMADTKRRGAWTAGPRLELLGIMSDTTIDLTQAILPDHDIEIDVTAFMAAVKIVVPRGMRVISRVSAFMGAARNRSELASPWANYPTLHITGSAIMAEVKVVVRDRR